MKYDRRKIYAVKTPNEIILSHVLDIAIGLDYRLGMDKFAYISRNAKVVYLKPNHGNRHGVLDGNEIFPVTMDSTEEYYYHNVDRHGYTPVTFADLEHFLGEYLEYKKI